MIIIFTYQSFELVKPLLSTSSGFLDSHIASSHREKSDVLIHGVVTVKVKCWQYSTQNPTQVEIGESFRSKHRQ